MLDAIIDKLTESIEDAHTGRRYDTRILPITTARALKLSSRWLFDWPAEIAVHEVFKLTIPAISGTTQGLIALERQAGFVFVHLLESHPQNVGRGKRYVGVAGNLMAHAASLSFELGFDGVIAFDAKTELIPHYERSLGASRVSSQRMALNTAAARRLVQKYFGDEHGTHPRT
jgi:hypothetical protein